MFKVNSFVHYNGSNFVLPHHLLPDKNALQNIHMHSHKSMAYINSFNVAVNYTVQTQTETMCA